MNRPEYLRQRKVRDSEDTGKERKGKKREEEEESEGEEVVEN